MNDRTAIAEYGDLARRVDLSEREIDAVVRLLNETDAPVLVLEDWLAEKKNIVPAEGEERVYSVAILDETPKAWQPATRGGREDDWVPKSQSELFERASGVAEIPTPSTTLSEFGGQR